MKQNNNQSKNNVNIFNYIPKKYSSYIFDTTTKYQKKFNFQMGTGEHATWNNEADAFKHTFMQAQLSLWLGKNLAKGLGDFHEFQGNHSMGQSIGENNMDNWNNQQGREIAKEIIHQYGPLAVIPSKRVNDIIAEKVMSRMRSGQLILTPADNRKYSPNLKEQPTGFGANIDINKIANVRGLQSINIQLPKQKEASGYAGYTNPLTGNNRIFTREEIGAMNDDEFAQNEKEIMAQIQAMNGIMPTNGDMLKESITGGGVVYVQPYTRSDGTKVQGYYRSRPGM